MAEENQSSVLYTYMAWHGVMEHEEKWIKLNLKSFLSLIFPCDDFKQN